MQSVLFLSADPAFPGDLYARRLAALLDARVIPIAGGGPLPDRAAYAAARAAWDSLDAAATPLIAASVLSAFAPLAEHPALRRAAVLMHAPLTAGEGLAAAEREALSAVEHHMLGLAPLIVASSEPAAIAIAEAAALPQARIAVLEPPTPDYPRTPLAADATPAILAPDAPPGVKLHRALFEALAGLSDLDWRVCIAGRDAGRAEAVKTLAERSGLASRVAFAVALDAARCEELWQRSALFVSLAASPGYGLGTAAALKRGLPVVIAGDRQTAPQVPPAAGAFVAPGDHVQLAKAMRRLIFDRELRAVMAEAAWQAGKALPSEGAVRERLLAALGR